MFVAQFGYHQRESKIECKRKTFFFRLSLVSRLCVQSESLILNRHQDHLTLFLSPSLALARSHHENMTSASFFDSLI